MAQLRMQFEARRKHHNSADDEETPSSSFSLAADDGGVNEERKQPKRQRIQVFNGMFVGDDFFQPLEVCALHLLFLPLSFSLHLLTYVHPES